MSVNIYDLFNKDEPRNETPAATVTPLRPVAAGLHPYAAAIRDAWLGRLDQLSAKPWQHGDAWDHNCFVTARKLVELSNSPWAGYSQSQAHDDFMAHAPHDGAWDQRQKCWDQGHEYSQNEALPEPPPNTPIPAASTLLAASPAPTQVAPGEEAEFWGSRPFLDHLRTFAQSRMTSPWAVLGAALARIVAATPYTVCLPPIVGGRGSINIFVGLVGPSGAGKGAAESVAAEAIRTRHVRAVRIASGEAITHVYKYRDKEGHKWRDSDHAALISVAEIDRLAGQSNRQGSTIMADLRSAWAGELLGQVAADSSRSIPLEAHEYRLALTAGIQPHRASVLLDDADGGTPQRFLWLPVNDPDSPEKLPDTPEPLDWRAPSTAPLVSYNGTQISVCDTAKDEIREARKATLRGEGDPLDGHALQCRLKTAAALGIADGRYAVTDEDWELAGVVQRKSADTRNRVLQTLAAKREREAVARAEADATRASIVEERQESDAMQRVVRRVLERVGEGGVRRSEVYRSLAGRDRQYFEPAVQVLVDSGQIEVRKAPSGSGKAVVTLEKRV